MSAHVRYARDARAAGETIADVIPDDAHYNPVSGRWVASELIADCVWHVTIYSAAGNVVDEYEQPD